MVGTGNGGFAADGRSREMNSGPAKILQAAKISRQKTTPQLTATLAKQKTKNCEETNL